MSELVINFSGVTKSYSIRERGYRTFRDSFSRSLNKVRQKFKRNPNNNLSNTDNNIIHALDNISFKVNQGEALGIIGANGSGKTTILRLLANVTEPSSGEITISGRVAPLIQVGAGFHPELTGRENVYLNASIMGLSKEETDEKYDDIVSFAEMEKFMDTPIKRYSSGMYIRLGFAVAANIDPDVLLIDEVLAVGDVNFQKKCFDNMSNIRRSNKTIVFISHNLSAVKNICDRIIWLDKGKIKKEGNNRDVISAYTSFMSSKLQYVGDNSYIGGRTRWGTGEAKITNVKVLNSNGKRQDKFVIGDEINIRLEYLTNEKIDSPTFEISIFNIDETLLFCSHYNKDRVGRYSISGSGILECVFNTTAMVPGNYYVTVDIMVEFGDLSYDRIGRAAVFVINKRKVEGFDKYDGFCSLGVINMPHEWNMLI